MTTNPSDSTPSRDARTSLGRVFEALAADWADESRADVLGGFLESMIGQMAAARGLESVQGTRMVDLSAAGIDWAAADSTLPGDVYTDLMEGQRVQGSYYTPRALADRVVGWVMGASPSLISTRSSDDATSPPAPLRTGEGRKLEPKKTEDGPRVLDLAMGGGHFLIAAADALAGPGSDSMGRWAVARSLHGTDRDPLAVLLARSALWLWAAHPGTEPDDLAETLLQGDALLDDLWPPASFDAVIGNPPYASVFTRAGDDPAERDAIHTRYPTAAGSYDLSVPFVEAALRLTREGGRCGLVIPNKLLAADYARTLREWMCERAEVEVLADYAESGAFEASVYPVVIIMRKGAPSADAPITVVRGTRSLTRKQADLRGAPGSVWSPVMAPDFEEVRRLWQGDAIPLGEKVNIAAGLTVDEAYTLRDSVIDAPPTLASGEFYPLITTGLIERGRVTWGQKRARFLKRSYRRPVIAGNALPFRRREQARGAKILLAGLGREPRAVYDPGGLLASVGTLIITEADWPLPLLCEWLNSPEVARLYQVLFGGLALSGGYLRFGKRELSLLPVPRSLADRDGWDPS